MVKAFTLPQPYAQLVAIGANSWIPVQEKIAYRGPLLITASDINDRGKLLFERPSILQKMIRAGIPWASDLPIFSLIATCQVVACLPMAEAQALGPIREIEVPYRYLNRPYAMKVEDVVRLSHPPMVGPCEEWWECSPAPVAPLLTGRLL